MSGRRALVVLTFIIASLVAFGCVDSSPEVGPDDDRDAFSPRNTETGGELSVDDIVLGASDVGATPGLIEVTYPVELHIDEAGPIEIELRAVDWRLDTPASRFNESGYELLFSAEGTERRSYPIYGALGTIVVHIEVGPELRITANQGENLGDSTLAIFDPDASRFEYADIAFKLVEEQAITLEEYHRRVAEEYRTLVGAFEVGYIDGPTFADLVTALESGQRQYDIHMEQLDERSPQFPGDDLERATAAASINPYRERILAEYRWLVSNYLQGDYSRDEFVRLSNDIEEQHESRVSTSPIVFERGTRNKASWSVRAVEEGTAQILITAHYVRQAEPLSPLNDSQLLKTNVDDMRLRLDLTVEAGQPTTTATTAPSSTQVPTTEPDATESAATDAEASKRRSAASLIIAIPPLLLAVLVPIMLLLSSLRDGPKSTATSNPLRIERRSKPQDLALVLSGGGTRAAAFSIGVLLYLIIGGKYSRLRQIASVSGGSLTNGFVATDRSVRSDDDVERAPVLDSLAIRLADKGIRLERSGFAFALLALLALAWTSYLGSRFLASELEGEGAATSFAAWSGALLGSAVMGVVLWLAYTRIGVRPVLRRWFSATIATSRTLRLSDIPPNPITHVFTSTARGSIHVHIAQRDLWFEQGPGNQTESQSTNPDKANLSEVVQASAAFPGLPNVRFDAEELGLDEKRGSLRLRDGGTFDNLGHIRDTIVRSDELSSDQGGSGWLTHWEQIGSWIVVDASARIDDKIFSRGNIGSRILEFLSLGVASDLADIAGSQVGRRTHETAMKLRKQFAETGGGIYVGLSDSPIDACHNAIDRILLPAEQEARRKVAKDAIRAGGDPSRAYEPQEGLERRAFDMLALLHAEPSAESSWNRRRNRTKNVRTTLAGLGPELVSGLAFHAFVLTMTHAHLELGWEIGINTEEYLELLAQAKEGRFAIEFP